MSKDRHLIVFPTELAMRRYQQEQALEHGWSDASSHTTFVRILKLCLPYAGINGRKMDAARQLLLRRQVVDVANGHFEGQSTLGELSPSALGEVLDQVVNELAAIPEQTSSVVEWMLDHNRNHKLHQLGTLFSIWRTNIKQDGWADKLDINQAILRLLKGDRSRWPPKLRDCRQLVFRSVRWFSPFEESCVAALNQRMKVRIQSALPPAHAEAAADRLGQQVRSEIMGEPWAVWTEDLGDAIAVDSADVLQLADSSRIDFSRSAGAYGEIEDLARRIGWNLQTHQTASNRIALVVPDIGKVQDIIPHVFSRFRIPYFFRRGRPVLSSPCVKAFLTWLAFPLHPDRNTFIDLVRNPAIHIDEREQTVEALLKGPPRIDLSRFSFFKGWETCSGVQAAEMLTERIVEPDDYFNSEALKTLAASLAGFGEQSLPLQELVDLTSELLEDSTIRPRESHEQGVWILNPHDAVGLEFDLVLFAGLNEGEFPDIPQQDALLSDTERYWLRQHLEEKGTVLPKMALAEASVLLTQESVLFLTALGMAREQLVLSYKSVDQEGNDLIEGDYYSKLWNLAGWCCHDEIRLSPYDAWRIGQLGEDNVFHRHWQQQMKTAREDRVPMPGESFLPIVPLPLCRAKDEALQATMHGGTTSVPSNGHTYEDGNPGCSRTQSPSSLKHLVAMLNIEAERDAYLDAAIDERTPSKYCGHIEALKERIADWLEQKRELSPTALQVLAECRYVFLLERIFGIQDARVMDDMPDPMDRGGLIHSILREIYTAVALGDCGFDTPRYWAVKTSTGWVRQAEPGLDAIPLATFVPEFSRAYKDFALKIANHRMDKVSLGHPGIWAAERQKILEIILNFIRHDIETCAAEHRFPALFELKFGEDTAVDLGEVRLHGIIDRVDLVFADSGELAKLRVLDYKGSSRKRSKPEEYVDEICRNLDCQFSVYAFAAQQFFFGAFNTDELNAMTEAGYLFYEREYPKIAKALDNSLLSMDEPGLLEGFLATLTSNLQRLKQGDFAVDPLIETYNDYRSVCRTAAVAREDLE